MANIAIEQQFQKVFVNVENVKVSYSEIIQQWPTFAKCFPNVRRLELKRGRVLNRVTGKPFQHLEQLKVEGVEYHGFTTQQFIDGLLNGAHQLKSLDAHLYNGYPLMPISGLLNLVKNKPLITKLAHDSPNKVMTVNAAEVNQMMDEHAALIELDLPNHQFTSSDAVRLIRGMSSLRKVTILMQQSHYQNMERQLNNEEWRAAVNSRRWKYFGGYLVVTLNR